MNTFDTGFRELLAKVYESLGDPVPTFVNVPIIPKRPESPTVTLSGTDTPMIDGISNKEEWDSSAIYSNGTNKEISELAYTMDSKKHLYSTEFCSNAFS